MSPSPSAETLHDRDILVDLIGVNRQFGAHRAVDGVDLSIREGEFFCLLGPSGCGKTTLMRMIAGFETPDAGRIMLDGRDINLVPPHQRPFNMMFQSYALFPHLTVAGNIGFGLKRAGKGRAETDSRVSGLLALLRMDGLGTRRIDQLSGGQKQRVALARALALKPRLLLLDEPLGALDRQLREAMQAELKSIQRELGTTFLVVTHDQDEAMGLADRIAIMEQGRILQVGTPEEIYERPTSWSAASFIGDMNGMAATVLRIEDGPANTRQANIRFDATGQVLTRVPVSAALTDDVAATFAIRPDKVHISLQPGKETAAALVESVQYRGHSTLVRVRLGPELITASIAGQIAYGVGDTVHIGFAIGSGILVPSR
jgi:putrescine transport system ATP-binding protein